MTSSYNARFKKQAILNLCLHVAFLVLNHHKQLHARRLCHRWAFWSLRVVVETYTHTQKKKTYGFHQMPRNAFGILWIHIITYLHSQLSNARLNVVQDLGQQFQTQLLVSHECIHSYLLANSKRQRHAMGICSIPLKRRTAQRSISTAGNGAHKHHAITQPQYYQNGA